jgi:hypothetical protein
MPGRVRLTARRRPGGRTPAGRRESGRSVSEEITALVNTFARARRYPLDRRGRRRTHPRFGRGPARLRRQRGGEEGGRAILAIMTACGFHDLVGQRVTKITETLDRVIATRMEAGREGAEARRGAVEQEEARSRRSGPSRHERRSGQHRRAVPPRQLGPTTQAHAWHQAGAPSLRRRVRQDAGRRVSQHPPRRRCLMAHAARSPRTRSRCRGSPRRQCRY